MITIKIIIISAVNHNLEKSLSKRRYVKVIGKIQITQTYQNNVTNVLILVIDLNSIKYKNNIKNNEIKLELNLKKALS